MSSIATELRGYALRTKVKLVIIILLASFIHLLLKLISFKFIIAIFDRFFSVKENPRPGKYLKQYSRLMATCYNVHSRFYNCLSLSVVFWILLKRHRVHVHIKFGTIKEADKMRFHAWLEYKGTPLAGDPDAMKYVPFSEIIA